MEFLKKFYFLSVFKKISRSIQENFMQFLRKFLSILMKTSRNFQKSFMCIKLKMINSKATRGSRVGVGHN